jgi:cytochrome c oxidase subunit III
MAVVESHAPHHDEHGGHGHDHHGEFIAHHFDSPEQQFDSGKLGVWLFLVTEVLFFSGLFVAYTLWRNHHPEIFEQAHVYLDKVLGGINTVVLLFSSLTMALGVRAAQLGRNRTCSIYVLITMVCAAVFLGVKAVEYSHKWDMGIFVRSAFHLRLEHAEPTTAIGQALHISDYLVYISILPTILLGVFLIGALLTRLNNMPHFSQLLVALAITVGGYFLGAFGGQVYQKLAEGDHGSGTHQTPHQEEPGHDHASNQPLVLHAQSAPTAMPSAQASAPAGELDPNIGIFFSIYYCLTGLHAIHITAGIVFLSWIYWRSVLGHWRSDYFGPVDYVGLYWHLVDLIWIYLFPLLYLID